MDFKVSEEKVSAEIKEALLCLPDVLNDLVISFRSYGNDEVDRQCSKPDCGNPISRRAFLKFNCRECIKCRAYVVRRPKICGYRYDNNAICKETYLDYHDHCGNIGCDGAVYCETCLQCPVCDPCH